MQLLSFVVAFLVAAAIALYIIYKKFHIATPEEENDRQTNVLSHQLGTRTIDHHPLSGHVQQVRKGSYTAESRHTGRRDHLVQQSLNMKYTEIS